MNLFHIISDEFTGYIKLENVMILYEQSKILQHKNKKKQKQIK